MPRLPLGKRGIFLFLSLLAFGGHMMDVHSTHVSLEAGNRETNENVQRILDAYGTPGFLAFKVGLLGVLLGAASLLFPKFPELSISMTAIAAAPAFFVSYGNYALAGWL